VQVGKAGMCKRLMLPCISARIGEAFVALFQLSCLVQFPQHKLQEKIMLLDRAEAGERGERSARTMHGTKAVGKVGGSKIFG